MIGKVFRAPKEVFESGLFMVVGRDTDPQYNPARKPWFLQVREFENGEVKGPWVPVTLQEFKKWNPDVAITAQQRVALGNKDGASQLC